MWGGGSSPLPATGTLRLLRGHEDGVEAVALSPDGRVVASGSADRTARLWDFQTGRELHRLTGHVGHVERINFSGDGRRVMTGSVDGTSRVWDVADGSLLAVLERHQGHVHYQGLSRDGKTAVTAGCDGTLRAWDVDAEREACRIALDSDPRPVAISPDGRFVAASAGTHDPSAGDPSDAQLRVYDARGGGLLRSMKLPAVPRTLAYGAEGSALVLTYQEHFGGPSTLRILDAGDFHDIRSADFYGEPDAVAVTADLKRALTHFDRIVWLWDIDGRVTLNGFLVDTTGSEVHDLALSPDGSRAAAGSGGTGDWFGRREQPPWKAEGTNEITACDFKPAALPGVLVTLPARQLPWVLLVADGARGVLLSPGARVAHRVDLAEGKISGDLTLPPAWHHPKLSSDGKRLGVRAGAGVEVFDLETGRRAYRWAPPAGEFLRDGAWDLIGSGDAAVAATAEAAPDAVLPEGAARLRTIDFKTGAEGEAVKCPGAAPVELTASPDGRWAVAWEPNRQQGEVPLFDLRAGAAVAPIRRAGAYLRAVRFLPDGRMATTFEDGVFLWRPETGQPLAKFDASRGRYEPAVFSPDGRALLTQTSEGRVGVWDSATGRGKAGATLTYSINGVIQSRNPLFFLPDGSCRRATLTAAGLNLMAVDFDPREGQ